MLEVCARSDERGVLGVAFRPRNYAAEEAAHSLPRVPADSHPLSSPPPSHPQDNIEGHEDNVFFDPLRMPDAEFSEDVEDVETSYASGLLSGDSFELQAKEWASFKRLLMHRFPVNKMVPLSSVFEAILNSVAAFEKSSKRVHASLEELNDQDIFVEDGVKFITTQEYISQLHKLRDEVSHAWSADDRVTSLKLSIKVARLLMDTSLLQFYPTLFVLAADILDMLGDLVWQRIRKKAEYSEDGSKIYSLPENLVVKDICIDAKETCRNWFFKIGSIWELLPRIYIEIAILPCWRFLLDQQEEILQRLVLMIRGLSDPLASAYCRLYLVHRVQKLPLNDIGCLIGCINDIKNPLLWALSEKDSQRNPLQRERILLSLMEPAIEYIMKCTVRGAYQKNQIGSVLKEFGFGKAQSELSGNFASVSIILHHLLKELQSKAVSVYAVDILHIIECSSDCSFDQYLNYRLLGLKLSECKSQIDRICEIVDKVMKVVTQFNSLNEYLKVVDAYIEIILQNQMDNHLHVVLDGILKRACNQGITGTELESLQSIILKLLAHCKDLQDLLALRHFFRILDVMHRNSRIIVCMHILGMGPRNGYIHDPAIIQFLFEISQALHDSIDFSEVKDDNNQQAAWLISRFVQKVNYGIELESHLTFLVECRGTFGSSSGLKETLVHSSNSLAAKAIKDPTKHDNFVKACLAFSEITIPSVSACTGQLNLYLETAEVALLGGLISHSDGLISSAISCLQTLETKDGSLTPVDNDVILSTIQKLCSYLVIVPGNPQQGMIHIPKHIVTLVCSQSWITTRMRAKLLCAIISLLATLSQYKLPYHAKDIKILGNDLLFFDDPSYEQELESLAEHVLQNLVDFIQQEPYGAARGVMALEACNCIASSFKANDKVSPICSTLVEIAKLCPDTDKYLQSTLLILDKSFLAPAASSIAIT